MVYNIQRINQLESDLKEKKEKIEIIKRENKTLKTITKDQTKGIDEYINKFNNTKEINEY
jgi:predicted RNase H-like nuclease (RuvC/YqgF family)